MHEWPVRPEGEAVSLSWAEGVRCLYSKHEGRMQLPDQPRLLQSATYPAHGSMLSVVQCGRIQHHSSTCPAGGSRRWGV